ncbi:MAG TPA: alkaline phosphatase [Terrimicrobiaceae bacterium]
MSKKIRNRFIALGCLIAFIGLGVLFYANWVVQKPFAIILFLTDNLTTSTLTAARIYQNGADTRLNLEKLPNLGLITTHAADFAVSDPSSAATAIATGQKVNNRSVGVDTSGKPLINLLDLARKHGRATGLISNAAISDTTPAAFYARTGTPQDSEDIAAQLVDAGNIDVILGGGEADFLPEHKEGRRKDGRDLLLEMSRKGFDIVHNRSEMESIPLWRAPRLLGIFSSGNLAFADEIQSAGSQPTLAEMVRMAIQLLQYNRKGYLLVVDCSLAGKAASQNEGERTLRELLALDEAVASALAFAGENSLLLVAGKQSVGGLRLNGYPFRNDKGVAIVGINSQGIPSLTWSTGPGTLSASAEAGVVSQASEPSAVPAPVAIGVAEDGIIVGAGPGSQQLQGFRDNTEIFRVIAANL